MTSYVIRAIVFEYKVEDQAYYETRPIGLSAWLGGSSSKTSVEHSLLKLTRVGLLIQYPPERKVVIKQEPELVINGIGHQLCRYHEGPAGIPEHQLYCITPSATPLGFCKEHSKSVLALFEKCAAGSLEACRLVDVVWRSEEYIVYVLDYGSSKAKVGLTRSWRFYWRIAEQPHVAAAIASRIKGNLVEARSIEKELASRRHATEGAGVKMDERLEEAVSVLTTSGNGARPLAARIAEKLSLLGLEGLFKAITILPREDPRTFLSRRLRPEDLRGRRLRLVDYWSGLLLLEDMRTRERIVLDKKHVLHRVLYGDISS
ncbi:MAG: hypothetical protein ABWW69_03010 [Pyrodictiaceae archaeon]